MRRPAPKLARRLARLSAGAHRFHRFAHHPLCIPYAPEVLRVHRRLYVCAGCTFAVSGAVAGTCLGVGCVVTHAQARLWGPGLQAAALIWLFVTIARHALRYKWLLRGTPCALAAWGVAMLLRSMPPRHWGSGLWITEASLATAGALAIFAYRRRPPWRTPCTTCPQRGREVCDGWQRIVQRERALMRLGGRVAEAYRRSHPHAPRH